MKSRLCFSILILVLSHIASGSDVEFQIQPPDCGCIESNILDREPNQPYAWNLYSRAHAGIAPDSLPKACATFCENKRRGGRNGRHFVLERIPVTVHARAKLSRFVCKCYEDVHPFDCDEEATGVQLTEVYCNRVAVEDVRRELPPPVTSARRLHDTDHTEPNLNYYHQQRSAISIQNFQDLMEEEEQQAQEEDHSERPRRRPAAESLTEQDERFSGAHGEQEQPHAEGARKEPHEDSEEKTKGAVAVSAIVLGMFAGLCLCGLATKTWFDHRGERKKREAAEAKAVSAEAAEEARQRSAAASRGRLMSLSAGPFVYEKK